MNSSDLTIDQLSKIWDRLRVEVEYYERLLERMGQRGFPVDDMLHRKVHSAHRSTRALLDEVSTLMDKYRVRPTREEGPGRWW